MAFVYGVLGLVVVLTASTFGTINASPWFNLGIAVLFVAPGAGDVRRVRDRLLALLRRRRRRRRRAAASRWPSRWAAVAALLAGACVAPVVIQVVLFASNLYATGHERGAGAAVLPRHRHGHSVADRRRRPGLAAEARPVDGAREAGLRRAHPRHCGVLRLPRVRPVRRTSGSTRPRSRRAWKRS